MSLRPILLLVLAGGLITIGIDADDQSISGNFYTSNNSSDSSDSDTDNDTDTEIASPARNNGMTPFYRLANRIIDAMHSQELDADDLKEIIDQFGGASEFGQLLSAIKTLLARQKVFTAVVLTFIILAILLPLVGFLYCLCSLCCCRGDGKRSEDRSGACAAVSGGLLLICVVVFAASTVLYVLDNNEMWTVVKRTPDELGDQAEAALRFVRGIPTVTMSSLREELHGFNRSLDSALRKFTDDTGGQFGPAPSLDNVTAVGDRLQIAYDQVCLQASSLEAQVTPYLPSVPNARAWNLPCSGTSRFNFTFNRANFSMDSSQAAFEQVLEKITAETAQQVDNVDRKLDEFDQIVRGIVETVSGSIDQINTNLTSKANEYIDRFDWVKYVLLIFVLPIALAGVFLLIGCSLGCLCGAGSGGKHSDGGCRNCAGHCLLCGVTFLFLLGFVVVLVAVLLMSVGYLGKTLVCQPLFERENLTMIDRILNEFEIPVPMNISDTIAECKQNQTLGRVFQLDQRMDFNNLRQTINQTLEQLERELNRTIDQITRQIEDGSALNESLNAFETGRSAANVMRNVFDMAISSTDSLLNSQEQISPELRQKLTTYREQLETTRADLTVYVDTLNDAEPKFRNYVDRLLTAVKNISTQRVPELTDNVLNSVSVLFNDVVDIVLNAGPCRPLYDVYKNLGVVFCYNIMNPWNGYWLALFLGVVFFVPAIIAGICLTGYFRKRSIAVAPNDARWR